MISHHSPLAHAAQAANPMAFQNPHVIMINDLEAQPVGEVDYMRMRQTMVLARAVKLFSIIDTVRDSSLLS